jgi:hypothetical protein
MYDKNSKDYQEGFKTGFTVAMDLIRKYAKGHKSNYLDIYIKFKKKSRNENK